jgi:myo-inositol-1(or 4)-monophosphatase
MSAADLLHPALTAAAEAATAALAQARRTHTREQLAAEHGPGADGTPTMTVDLLVEEQILAALAPFRVNVLSEEAGLVDRGSALTVVLDPVDGSANAAAGVPLSCLSAALAVDGVFEQAATCWLDTGQTWYAATGRGAFDPAGRPLRTSGRRTLTGSALSLLRPHPGTPAEHAWWQVARRAKRVRVLSCSTLDIALVAQGSVDAFADSGTDTHRLVDLAAAAVFAAAGAGHLRDVHGRAIELDTDLTRRWSGVYAATAELADELADEICTGLQR